MTEFNDFQRLDIRTGKIIEIEDFPESRNPSYKLKINFGKSIGIKNSSAQLVDNYKKDELKNKEILAIVNLPAKKIGTFTSEVLTLGIPDENSKCILIKPDKNAPLGAKLY
ncbi:MAG: tRNA-binding protein [archaeon]